MGARDKGYAIAGPRWNLSRYRNGVCLLHNVESDPEEQINRWGDPSCLAIRGALDHLLQNWIIGSVMDGDMDKTCPHMTMTPDDPGHQPGWCDPILPMPGSRRSWPA